MRTLTARRWGHCPECGGPISVGNTIARIGGSALWAHLACAEDRLRRIRLDDDDALAYGGRA